MVGIRTIQLLICAVRNRLLRGPEYFKSGSADSTVGPQFGTGIYGSNYLFTADQSSTKLNQIFRIWQYFFLFTILAFLNAVSRGPKIK
jgi:hypothetical protein